MDIPTLQLRLRDALQRTDAYTIGKFLRVEPRRIVAFSKGVVGLSLQHLLRLDAIISHKVPKVRKVGTPLESFEEARERWRPEWGQHALWPLLEMLWRCAGGRPISSAKWLPPDWPEGFRHKLQFVAFVRRLDFRYRRYMARSYQWRFRWQARVKDNTSLGFWLRAMIFREDGRGRQTSSATPAGKTSGNAG